MLLEKDDYYVDPDITKARLLPARAYTEQEVLHEEMKRIFERSWLFVPLRSKKKLQKDPRSLTEILSIPGGEDEFWLLEEKPFFLKRDREGGLHCFSNVCTHWGSRLVRGPGTRDIIECPTHGRQFNDRGRFAAHKNLAGCRSLNEFSVEEWKQFFFVCPGSPFMPLPEFIKDMQDTLEEGLIETFQRRPLTREEREVDGNWKLHALVYLDRFHLTWVHGKTLAPAVSAYKIKPYRNSFLQWAYAKNPEHGIDPRKLPNFASIDPEAKERPLYAVWWFIPPNLTVNLWKWGLSINVYMPIPGKPDKTRFLWYHYVEETKSYRNRNKIWCDAELDREDIEAMREVRNGVRSGFYDRGEFVPDEEIGPHWFQRWWYKTMFDT